MNSTILNLLMIYRYWILFPLAVFEGPIVSLVTGFLIHIGALSFWPAFVILILGDIIPDSILYFIGYWGGNTKLVQKLISSSDFFNKHFDSVGKLWTEHGRVTMFLGKLAYGMALPFIVSAGIVKIPFKKFISYTIPVTILQYGIIISIGYSSGKLYAAAGKYVDLFYFTIAILIIAIAAIYLVAKYARNKIVSFEKNVKE